MDKVLSLLNEYNYTKNPSDIDGLEFSKEDELFIYRVCITRPTHICFRADKKGTNFKSDVNILTSELLNNETCIGSIRQELRRGIEDIQLVYNDFENVSFKLDESEYSYSLPPIISKVVLPPIFDKKFIKKEKSLKHILTGLTGTFVKEYYATGYGYLTQIRLFNNEIYYAPSCEFVNVD